MNLRDIKREIEQVAGAFIDDCTLFLNANPGKNTEEITGLIDKATDLYNGLRDKVNHPEGNKRAYYQQLRTELTTQVEALYEQLGKAAKTGLAEKE